MNFSNGNNFKLTNLFYKYKNKKEINNILLTKNSFNLIQFLTISNSNKHHKEYTNPEN